MAWQTRSLACIRFTQEPCLKRRSGHAWDGANRIRTRSLEPRGFSTRPRSGLPSRKVSVVEAERDWREYERQIHERLVRMAGGDESAKVEFDARLPGELSGVDRQVDVYVEGAFAGAVGRGTMAVDCKCFSRKVDVKDVEAFMGLVDDVATDFGLIVTTEGYSHAAERRLGQRGFRFDIVPYDDIEDWAPEVVFCPVCTDMDSDRAPGPLYLDPADDRITGSELVNGVGRCWNCNTLSMRCKCGNLNTLMEAEEGEWRECEGGCGIEWRGEEQLDRKGTPEGDLIEFRRPSSPA